MSTVDGTNGRKERKDTMPSRAKLEALYGLEGADLKEAVPESSIATNGNVPFHVHFRSNRVVTDAIVRLASRLTKLEELVANDTAITDMGLAHLSGLSNLHLLHLSGTAVTDAGLVQLGALPLEVLDLCRTRVTDVGLERLRAIKTLREVWIIGCGCSEGGVEGLQSALPICRIVTKG